MACAVLAVGAGGLAGAQEAAREGSWRPAGQHKLMFRLLQIWRSKGTVLQELMAGTGMGG